MDWLTNFDVSSTNFVTAVLLGAVVLFLYVDFKEKYSYFKKKGIKGPKPKPFVGNILERFTKSIVEIDTNYDKRYGKLYGYYDMSTPITCIADPKVIKNIMVRHFAHFVDRRDIVVNKLTKYFLAMMKGDEWRRARNVLSPTFTSGKMKAMLPLMSESVKQLDLILQEKSSSGEDIEAKTLFAFFTLDVIARCAFGLPTDVLQKGYESDFLKKAKPLIVAPDWITFAFRFMPQFLKDACANSYVTKMIEDLIRGFIEERSKPENKRNYKDFLQLMMDAMAGQGSVDDYVADSEGHHGYENEEQFKEVKVKGSLSISINVDALKKAKGNSKSTPEKELRGTLTIDEVVANVLLFLAAGYETTSTLLTYVTYCLAMNPEKQDKLRKEITDAFEAAGNTIRYEDVSSLKYLDAVVSETLRLFPPGMRLGRKCTSDCDVQIDLEGEIKTLELREGDVVQFPIYVIHHNPEYYPDPESFEPSRFLPENRHLLTPYTYLPFGAGPRNCIGMRFALLQVKLCLMKSLLSYQFLPSDKTPSSPNMFESNEILSPRNMFLRVEKLEN